MRSFGTARPGGSPLPALHGAGRRSHTKQRSAAEELRDLRASFGARGHGGVRSHDAEDAQRAALAARNDHRGLGIEAAAARPAALALLAQTARRERGVEQRNCGRHRSGVRGRRAAAALGGAPVAAAARPRVAWIVKDVRGSESNCEHDSREM